MIRRKSNGWCADGKRCYGWRATLSGNESVLDCGLPWAKRFAIRRGNCKSQDLKNLTVASWRVIIGYERLFQEMIG